MNTPVTVDLRDFLNNDCSSQLWFCKLLVTITRADTRGGLKCVAFFKRHCVPIRTGNTPFSQKNQWLTLSSIDFMSSIYCYYLTVLAKMFCELSTLCILNLTYIPEYLIFPGREEQWNWRVIGASPVAFEKCLPKGISSFINMLNCHSQSWMEVKKGAWSVFLLSQDTHSSISFGRNECKTDCIKWQHESNSECASASLAPLVSAGSSCGLEGTDITTEFPAKEEPEVPECK